jgi:hypothetical protein
VDVDLMISPQTGASAASVANPPASTRAPSTVRPARDVLAQRRALLAVLANRYAILTAILALVMAPAWVTTSLLVVGGDVHVIHYPWFVLWRESLAAGEFPFWNPYSFSGIPAFATLQAGYGYPLHWLLTPLPPIQAINWLVGLHVLIAGLGTAWTAGRLGAGREGQVLAGLSYALGSALVARMWAGHLSFLEANAWLPLATGLALEIGARRRVVLLALVVALMTLAGQPEIVIFSLWWLPIWAAFGALQSGRRAVVLALGRLVFAMALGGGLAAFQMLPVLEVLGISNRQARMEWDFRIAASLPPWHLLELVGPLSFGDPRGGYWPGPFYEWHERLLYVGIVPLLAAGCLAGRWRWLCLGAAVVAVAFAFGGYAPWYPLVELLPGYANLRIPSKHLGLAALALALAAGVGLDRLQGRKAAGITVVLAAIVAVLGSTMDLWVPMLASLAGGSELVTSQARRTLAGSTSAGVLAAVVVLVLAALAMRLPAALPRRAILVALAAVELVVVLQPFRLRYADPAQVVADSAVFRSYQRAALIGEGAPVLANYGPVTHVQQPGGYVSLFSGEYMTLVTGRSNAKVEIEIQRDAVPFLYLLGYEAVIDRRGGRDSVLELKAPRAWVARCTWPGGAREVRDASFPRQACVTHRSAQAREAPVDPGVARIVAEGNNWLTIEADGPGWLVTTRPWYPGWTAQAAGASLPVEPVDGALVGVALPPGQQTVTISYRPAGLDLGLAISALAALILAALWWLGRLRRPVRSSP